MAYGGNDCQKRAVIQRGTLNRPCDRGVMYGRRGWTTSVAIFEIMDIVHIFVMILLRGSNLIAVTYQFLHSPSKFACFFYSYNTAVSVSSLKDV